MIIKIARAVALVIGCAGLTHMPDTRIQREMAFLCVVEVRCDVSHELPSHEAHEVSLYEANVSLLGEAAGGLFAALAHHR